MTRDLGSITFTATLLDEDGGFSIDVVIDLSARMQLSRDDMPDLEKAMALAATREAGLQVTLFFTHLLAAERRRIHRSRAEDDLPP